MKKIVLFSLFLSQISFASECTVSISGLRSSDLLVNLVLKHKGYVVTDANARFSIEGQDYLSQYSEKYKQVVMIDRLSGATVASMERPISLLKRYRTIERKFLMSLPQCNL